MSLVLLEALQNPDLYPHPVSQFEVIETHISWVLLTGRFAYKIKKPENFGFLDFSSLDKRYHYCQEELRLNHRLAPQIYLEVVSIYGPEKAPRFTPPGEPIEYAVKMVQFSQDQLLDQLLESHRLTAPLIEQAARTVAAFHLQAPSAQNDTEYGLPEQIAGPVADNFKLIKTCLETKTELDRLAPLEQWTRAEKKRLEPVILERKRQGRIKECHGDLHLGNITLIDNRITLFDCIEFSESLRWIDTINEIAFLVMDLQARSQHALANRFLNTYLEATGDYSGLALLAYYQSYRAMVRAKVALLSLDPSSTHRNRIKRRYRRYVDLAGSYRYGSKPYMLLMHGFSGTGKTTVSTELVDQLGAIRIRSDVERKRLFAPPGQQNQGVNKGIYSHKVSDQTFDHLASLAETICNAGYPVIVDATFLHKAYRTHFYKLAQDLAIPWGMVSCELADTEVRKRLVDRQSAGMDPSDADVSVYQAQLASADSLSESELDHTYHINTADTSQLRALLAEIRVGLNLSC